jgi:hypothetical protein
MKETLNFYFFLLKEQTMLNGELGESLGQNEFKITSLDLSKLIKMSLKLNVCYCIDDLLNTQQQVCKMLRFKKEFTSKDLEIIGKENESKILISINL